MLNFDERFDTVNEQIKLIQKKNGLTFGTDAYLLAAYVRALPHERGVDLGSGTGIIPMLCMSRGKAAHFHAIEIQPSFAELIGRNLELNGFTESITHLCADIRNITPADIRGEVGIVTANPPYMTVNSGARNLNDEKYLARHEVCGSIFDFCAAAGRLLKHGGRFFCVFRPARLVEALIAMRNSKLEPKRITPVQSTGLSEPSIILIEAQKGASPSVTLTPPLCLWQADEMTPEKPAHPLVSTYESDYIYENCAFPAQFTLANK